MRAKPGKKVKRRNNDAMAIKMVDNPANLQAVIPNEIIIISTIKRTNISFSKSNIPVTLLKYSLYNGFIKALMPKITGDISLIIRKFMTSF